MTKCEKIFSSLYKETQGMQHLDYPPLHQDALPTQNHVPHILLLVSDFQAIEEAVPLRHSVLQSRSKY